MDYGGLLAQLEHRHEAAGLDAAVIADRRAVVDRERRAARILQHAELLQHFDCGSVQRARAAVGDADGDAESVAGDSDRLHAIGTRLADPVASAGLHDRQIGPARSRHEVRMSRHREVQCCQLRRFLCGQPGVGLREPPQRQCEVGRTAAIDALRDAVTLRKARDDRADALLQWVTAVEVSLGRLVVHAAIREETRVFARAVVEQRRPLDPGRCRRFSRGEEAGRMAAALQCRVIESGSGEHALHEADVYGLAAVAGAHHGQLMRREAVAAQPAILDERQCLQRLEGRTREIERVWIADRGDQLAGRIDHRNRAVVHALGGPAARGLDQGYMTWNQRRPSATPRAGRGCTVKRIPALGAAAAHVLRRAGRSGRQEACAVAPQFPCGSGSGPARN